LAHCLKIRGYTFFTIIIQTNLLEFDLLPEVLMKNYRRVWRNIVRERSTGGISPTAHKCNYCTQTLKKLRNTAEVQLIFSLVP
jgi:hypothetical protein